MPVSVKILYTTYKINSTLLPAAVACILFVMTVITPVPGQQAAKQVKDQREMQGADDLQRNRNSTLKTTDELLRELIRRKYERERGLLGVQTPDELLKYLVRKEWYRYKKDQVPGKTGKESLETLHQGDADLTGIKKSASEDMHNIVVLLGEIPVSSQEPVYAPVFIADRQKIFGSNTDFSFTWVGYKATMKLTQKKFPWKNTSLNETFIGSFLYASGTNIGFVSGNLQEEVRFYTNYVSELVTLTWHLPYRFSTAFTLDSRQYFFVERDVPEEFVMPKNHVNLFPRIDFGYDRQTEKGIDQITEGLRVSSWIGYGIRNRWEQWGLPPEYEAGEEARHFTIYSFTLTYGMLFRRSHNIVFRGRYKGGINNDFLTRPRFGGSIDNAKLDVVHGFTVDSFRVNNFSLLNMRYGFDLFSRLRLNFFLDYARIFSPDREDVLGSAYGIRIISFGGLPIWLTHSIGRAVYPENQPWEQVIMVMTAAGW